MLDYVIYKTKHLVGKGGTAVCPDFCPGHRSNTTGQSTLELLVALGILLTSIVAGISVFFGGQSLVIDTRSSDEAIYLARQSLEEARSLASANFSGVVSASSTQGRFSKELVVEDLDADTKKVTSRITWEITPLRQGKVEFSTRLTDWRNVAPPPDPGDMGGSGLSGDWGNPKTLGSIDLGPGVSATDLDVVSKMVYMTGQASAASKPDFFIINATDGANPYIVSSLNTTDQGLEAIDAAGNYAYVANSNNAKDKQLEIIDITDKANPSLLASYTLPGAKEIGVSVFYAYQKVYVGTKANSGPEFFVVDVSNPANPVFLGSKEIGYDVNAIYVSGSTAYIATPDSKELKILDVSNPANITIRGEYDIAGNCEGKSLYLVSRKLYFGRVNSCAAAVFSVLNVASSSNVSALGSANIGSDVNGIVVRDYLAFLATSDSNKEFQVWNISNPSNITPVSSFNFPQVATGIDYEDNIVYVSVRSNDALRIITSQ